MSYVLGFFMADGSITINPRGSEYFAIQIIDKDILEKIKKIMKSEHKITKRIRKPTEQPIYRIQIGSKEMCEDLRKLGVKELKTKTMRLPNIPDKYFGDFVRGYFDGDGNVWVGQIHKDRKKCMFAIRTVFVSCSHNFLEDLKNRLHKFELNNGSFYGSNRAYRIQYSIKNSVLLYHLMYDNLKSDLFLSRKKNTFDKYLKMQS